MVVALVAIAIPVVPFMGALGFVPLPWKMSAAVIGITLAYAAATEFVKLKLWDDREAVLLARP